MELFKNGGDAHLTTWGTSPEERNEVKEITFLLSLSKEVKVGDAIQGRPASDGRPASYFIIEKIIEARPARLSGYSFIKAEAKYSNKTPL